MRSAKREGKHQSEPGPMATETAYAVTNKHGKTWKDFEVSSHFLTRRRNYLLENLLIDIGKLLYLQTSLSRFMLAELFEKSLLFRCAVENI